MALKKVAPTNQWQGRAKGASPTTFYLIAAGTPVEYTLTADRSLATHVAKYNSAAGDYDVVAIGTPAAARIIGIAVASDYRII